MTRRSIDDITARADEFADAFENYDPKPGDQGASLSPVVVKRDQSLSPDRLRLRHVVGEVCQALVVPAAVDPMQWPPDRPGTNGCSSSRRC